MQGKNMGIKHCKITIFSSNSIIYFKILFSSGVWESDALYSHLYRNK